MNEILKTQHYKLIEGRHGRFLANPQDIYLGRSMIAYGEFSELEWRFLSQLVQPGAYVVEAGANMGALTVPIAKNAGRAGMVYAFEPQSLVYQQMCANVALNDLVNVQTFNAACGEEDDWFSVLRTDPSSETNFGGISLERMSGNSPVRVRIERLDNVLDVPKIDLIKADVEGMELQVLRGAAELIQLHRPFLYLEADQIHAPDLIRGVQDLDYRVFWHTPPMFSPENYFENQENLFGGICSFNAFCVPAERSTQIRVMKEAKDPDDHPLNWNTQRKLD